MISNNNYKANHLYIIGNGFDLYHGANSRYNDFHDYLLKHDITIASTFDFFFGHTSHLKNFKSARNYLDCINNILGVSHKEYDTPSWSKRNLWSDFETHLADLDREKVIDFIELFISKKDPSDDDASTSEIFIPISHCTDLINNITDKMKFHIHKWINTVHYEKNFKNKLINIDSNALFLNFNYTTFLEDVYCIDKEKINYIYGCRKDKIGSLIIGHNHVDNLGDLNSWITKNKHRKRFSPVLKNKKGKYYANNQLAYLTYFLDDDKKGNYPYINTYITKLEIYGSIENYYEENLKDTKKVISNNYNFFSSLNGINLITVLGHSLGDVDIPYFQEIIKHNNNPSAINWEFSYYSNDDKKKIKRFCGLMHIGQQRMRIFNISELS